MEDKYIGKVGTQERDRYEQGGSLNLKYKL